MKMKKNSTRKRSALVAVQIATVIIAVVIAVLAPALRPHGDQPRVQPITCINNEKQLGIAFRGFGIDAGAFPMQVSNTNVPVNPTPQ